MVGNRGVRKCIEQEFLIRRAMGVISDDNARATKPEISACAGGELEASLEQERI
jgi:hypothetical protein